MNELTTILFTLIPSESTLIYCPLPLDDPTNRRPDITLAKEILDWTPKVDIKEGLLKTIEYIRSN